MAYQNDAALYNIRTYYVLSFIVFNSTIYTYNNNKAYVVPFDASTIIVQCECVHRV